MIERTGIFAGLRRRRWVLCLAFGYALFLNALLGTSVEGALAAARSDPLAVAAASLCDPAPAAPHHAPADHQQTCPLCGPACPMGGCAPVQTGPGLLGFSAPRQVVLAAVDWVGRGTIASRSLYASDIDSQGPPAV